MIESAQITNKDGSTYYQINDDNTPLTDFDVTIARRADTNRNRSQSHGVNPTISLKGGMEIHIEGALFDDDSGLYVARRKNLVLAVEGDPNIAPDLATRYDLTLSVTFTGETEAWTAQCIVSEFTSAVQALYPALTQFALTLFSWNPWFVGANTSTKYYWT